MGEPDFNNTVDYVLSSQLGNIKTHGNKQLNKVVFDGKEYSYNKEKELSNRLKNRLETVSKTQGFKRFNILKNATKGIAVRENMPLVKKQGS